MRTCCGISKPLIEKLSALLKFSRLCGLPLIAGRVNPTEFDFLDSSLGNSFASRVGYEDNRNRRGIPKLPAFLSCRTGREDTRIVKR